MSFYPFFSLFQRGFKSRQMASAISDFCLENDGLADVISFSLSELCIADTWEPNKDFHIFLTIPCLVWWFWFLVELRKAAENL